MIQLYKVINCFKQEIERVTMTHCSDLPIAVIKSKCDSSRSRNVLSVAEDNISRWWGTLFQCSAKRGVNIAELEEFYCQRVPLQKKIKQLQTFLGINQVV